MRLSAALAAVALLLAPAAPVAAQPRPQPIKLGAAKPFKHRHSRVEIPARLAGLPRTQLVEIEGDQLDVTANFEDPARGEFLTVYVTRLVAGAIPVWFDRAAWMVENRKVYGDATRATAAPFVPPGQASASALIATYDLAGSDFRSSGVAIVPVGEWMVKLRASSRTATGAELAPRMQEVLRSIRWPKPRAAAPPAEFVLECRTGLDLSGEAQVAPADGAASLLDAMLGRAGADASSGAGSERQQGRWCRDPAQVDIAAVYRLDERRDAYLLALADSGRALSVAPSAGAQLMAAANKIGGPRPTWSASLVQLSRTLNLPPLDRLPPPTQAQALMNAGKFISATPTWGKSRSIAISPDALD